MPKKTIKNFETSKNLDILNSEQNNNLININNIHNISFMSNDNNENKNLNTNVNNINNNFENLYEKIKNNFNDKTLDNDKKFSHGQNNNILTNNFFNNFNNILFKDNQMDLIKNTLLLNNLDNQLKDPYQILNKDVELLTKNIGIQDNQENLRKLLIQNLSEQSNNLPFIYNNLNTAQNLLMLNNSNLLNQQIEMLQKSCTFPMNLKNKGVDDLMSSAQKTDIINHLINFSKNNYNY